MRINIINGIIAIVEISTIILTGCSKDKNLLSEQTEGPLKSSYSEPADEMILGNKIDNPYSVANMTIAYSNLINKSSKGYSKEPDMFNNIDLNVVVETTHLYIRFKPQDTTEYKYLIDESGLQLFSYPLDYEIIQIGNYYECPNLSPGEYPYFYTSVPVEDVPRIQIKFETLEECYIPDDKEIDEETAFLLELEAMLETELITELEYGEALSSKGSKTPSGYIKVWNTSRNANDGVKKVKMIVNNFVKWDAVFTNENGYYKMDKSWATKVNYSLQFENSTGFKIWGNLAFFAPAIYCMGWNSNSGHDKDFGTGSVGWLWSAINNAAYIYREKMCPDYNITKPPSDLRIWAVRSGSALGAAPMARRFSIGNSNLTAFLSAFNVITITAILNVMPDIFIIKDFNKTKDCYETVFHELAHATHYQKVGGTYWLKYVIAIGLNGGYGNGSQTNAGYIGVGEMWGFFLEWKCMNNQAKLGFSDFGTVNLTGTSHWFKPQIMKELNVTCGLTVKQIYDCLTSDVYSHQLLKAKLKSKHPSLSQQIDKAFSDYGF